MAPYRARISIQDRDGLFQIGLAAKIIACSPFEILAVGQLEDPVEVRYRPQIPPLAPIANTRILLGIVATDRFGAISRCVVGNDQFEVFKSLRQQGNQRLLKKFLAVVDGKAYRYFFPKR